MTRLSPFSHENFEHNIGSVYGSAGIPIPDSVLSDSKATVKIAEGEADSYGGSVLGDDSPKEAAEPVAPTSTEQYFRPNGEEYLPRTLDSYSMTDVDFVRKAYGQNMPVLLDGPPGSGKTALIEAALADVVTVQGSLDTEPSDFIGSWVQLEDGTYGWTDGPLVVAMEQGRPMLIDEIALIDPRTMAVVYSAMDGRGEVEITTNPNRGKAIAKEGFLVFGAYNPGVLGAHISDALLSRFTLGVEMVTDWDIARKLGVDSKAIQVAENLALKEANHEVHASPQLRELLAFRDVSKAFSVELALANLIGFAVESDVKAYTEAVRSVFGTVSNGLRF